MTFVKCNYLAIYLSTFTKKYSVQHTLLYIVGTINGRILYVRYKDGTRTDWLCTRTWARLIVCRMCVRYVEKSEPVVNYSILLKFDVYDFCISVLARESETQLDASMSALFSNHRKWLWWEAWRIVLNIN